MKTAEVKLFVTYDPNATNPSFWDWEDLVNQPIRNMNDTDMSRYFCGVEVESIMDNNSPVKKKDLPKTSKKLTLYSITYRIKNDKDKFILGNHERLIVAYDMDAALAEFHRVVPSYKAHVIVIDNMRTLHEDIHVGF